MITWAINWLLDHTGKRWKEEQEHTLRMNAYYDAVIGQLEPRDA
jgi:hypothetical protein